MSRKKQSRRSKQKYPALTKGYNLKRRAELLDIDYVDKLSEKEKAWYNAFLEEEVNANFNHEGPKVNPRNKKNKKRVYDANNARNRDILTRVKASGSDYELRESDSYSIEDEIIEKIDRERKK